LKALLFKLFVIICPIGLLISSVNYLVDPANIFTSKEYVAGVAEILSRGHNVDHISNYNERLLQEQMIRRLKKTPDIIVLGSSRIMEIGSDFFPGKTVLNCGVSHANIHDLIAISGLLDSLGHLPGELFINLDPELISEKGTSEWQSLSGYHEYFIKKYVYPNTEVRPSYSSNEVHKLLSLFSFAYFKESVNHLFKGDTKKYYDIGRNRPQLYGRFSDGSICYPGTYTHPDTLKIAADALTTGSKEGLSQPDSGKIRLLKALIDFLKGRHVRIHFIMLPFHPEFYEAVNARQSDLFISYYTYFQKLASQENVPVEGNFNSLALHIPGSAFYDMYHCSKDAIKSIGLTE
jgi:hypothetical protein